ncbi:MAG: AarF/ABC1/UbiB kinase family protein [Myxococcales bacterium]|nr:AarF/ABC1/UbiB kinase family protein [Myxococcales bacterium]
MADDGDADLDVVVKLQRPTARAVVERDLELLYMFARLVERYVPESRVYAPLALVREFDRAITAELDYGLEADNARRFAKNFDGWTTVRFPVPYREASGKRALVMERLRGARLEDFVAGNDAGPRIARQALAVIAKMIFEDGFFHADPHPGNIIMLGTPAAPVVGLIDLGLVGQLTAETRDRMIDVMISAVTGDTGALADGLLAMGTARRQVDRNAFRSEVATLAGKYLGRPLAEIELSAVIRDLVQGAVKYDIEMPPEMLMVGKALMTVEGIGRQLDPDLDVWAELQPILTRIVRDRYSPQRIGRDLLRAARQLGTSATALPGQITDVLDDLRAGQLTVVSRDPGLAAATDRLGRRLFTAILVAALVGAGTALLIADRHGTTAVGLLVTAAALLALHVVGDRRRDRQRPG